MTQVLFVTLDPPGPPENLHIEDLTKSSCTLLWEKPAFDGGSPITGYYIEKSSGYSQRWIKVNRQPIDTLTQTFSDLMEDTQYEYRVCAENEAGIGKPSQTTGAFKAKDPFTTPGKPGTPEVTEITKDAATLKWTAPAKDGGAPLTGYVVEMKEQGATKWSQVTPKPVKDTEFKVEGLQEGSKYEFRVAAVNKAGQGAPSAASRTAQYGEYGISQVDKPSGNLITNSVLTQSRSVARAINKILFNKMCILKTLT